MTFLIVGGNKESRKREIEKLYQRLKPTKPQNDPDQIILEKDHIGIEEIRDLKHWLSLKPYLEPPKIVVIPESQNLTPEAQGALGKIIEELPETTVIILASPNQEQLSPMIVSRCQVFNLPQEAEFTLSQNEIKSHQAELEEILKSSPGERILFAEKMKGRGEAEMFCQIQLLLWREMLLKNPTREISQIIRQIQKTLKYLKANVNPRLAIENLLLLYPHLQPQQPTTNPPPARL